MNNNNGNNSANDGNDVSGLGLGNDSLLDNGQSNNNNGQNGNQNNNGQNNQNNSNTNNNQNNNNNSNQSKPIEFEGKSYQVDEKGNLLNEDKTIFKSKEDYDKVLASQSNQNNNQPVIVNLDGKDYKLDEKGNALGEDGKIFKTKEELDAIEAESIPLVVELSQKVGIIVKDDKGNPKVYEDSPEGLLQWTNDIAEVKAKNAFNKLIEQNSEVKAYNDFLQRGGKPEEYFERKNSSWKNVKLDDKNETQLLNVIEADLMAAGMDEEQAKFTAKTYKDTDKLKEFAKMAHKRLVDFEVTRDAEEAKQYEEYQKQTQERHKNYWNQINQIVSKGTLQNITIPENERSEFFQFISKDVDGKGNTQAAINKSKADTQTLLAIEYLFFKGLDLNKLVTNAAKTQQVRTLRTRLSGSQRGLGNGQGINKDEYNKSANVDISLDNF